MKFLIDTSIWMDLYEDRIGFSQEPLGKYAAKLFMHILTNRHVIAVTDLLIAELKNKLGLEQVNGLFKPFETENVLVTLSQRAEADKISKERNVPRGDALHTILARDYELTLITRDKHFYLLTDISNYYKPEELI